MLDEKYKLRKLQSIAELLGNIIIVFIIFIINIITINFVKQFRHWLGNSEMAR